MRFGVSVRSGSDGNALTMSETQQSPHADSNAGSRRPREPDEIAREELEAFRQSSPTERGRMLAIACRSAARLDRSRREAGLPAPVAEPWPQSTWEFLTQQAARYVHG